MGELGVDTPLGVFAQRHQRNTVPCCYFPELPHTDQVGAGGTDKNIGTIATSSGPGGGDSHGVAKLRRRIRTERINRHPQRVRHAVPGAQVSNHEPQERAGVRAYRCSSGALARGADRPDDSPDHQHRTEDQAHRPFQQDQQQHGKRWCFLPGFSLRNAMQRRGIGHEQRARAQQQ